MYPHPRRARRRLLQPTPSLFSTDSSPAIGRGSSASPAPPRLVLAVAGQVLTPAGPLVLGAAPGCDVVVEHPHVSARHVVVQPCDPEAVLVKDLGSTNGTWWRGRRLKPGAPQRVPTSDCILLGRSPVLVGRGVPRYPAAMLWQGMMMRDRRSLSVLAELARMASFDAPVWVRGESGTGKEGACRALHAASPRQAGPFVALNCAALPESLAETELFGSERGAFTGAQKRSGAFVRADGGTLLLDEVGELPGGVQAKLLRVLETGEVRPVGGSGTRRVDVRVVCSTWRDLNADADNGRFRFDLLQRLSVLQATLPPLRDRPGDIPALTDHLLAEQGAAAMRPDPAAKRWLVNHRWPGNIRELRNTIRRVVVAGGWSEALPELEPRSGPGGLDPRMDARDTTYASDRRNTLAHLAVRQSSGNRARAARSLGVSRSTLYRWLARTG